MLLIVSQKIFITKQLWDRWDHFLLSSIEKVYLIQRDQMISKSVFDYLVYHMKSSSSIISKPEVLLHLSALLNEGSLGLNDFSNNNNNIKDYRIMLWQVLIQRSITIICNDNNLVK